MEIVPTPGRSNRLDLTVYDIILQQKLLIMPGCRVRCGTPLVPGENAWRPAREGETPIMFALNPADGGETVACCKGMIVDTHRNEFKVGQRIKVATVQDSGALTFEIDPNGRYLALTPSRILLA